MHLHATRTLRGLGGVLVIHRVDEHGNAAPIAEAHLLRGGATSLEYGEQEHRFEGLPPTLADMAPDGYLGARFAALHADLGLPRKLKDWSDDDVLTALARRGEGLPGNLLVANESVARFLDSATQETPHSNYPELAVASATGRVESFVGGAYPKFPAFRDERHLLVKFSLGDGSPSDERWSDLLVCEALASAVLSTHGIAAAESRIVDVGTRRFLETVRFDRIGARGRRGVITLGPLDDDLFGGRDSWTAAAARFEDAGLLSTEESRTVRLLDAFGLCIANNDRHFGNLAFFADTLLVRPALRLAPSYDQLPMDLAPRAGVLPTLGPVPVATAKLLDVWNDALRLSHVFWERVSDDARISLPFRHLAARRLAASPIPAAC